MKNLRDKALLTLQTSFNGSWKAESLAEFQGVLQGLSSEQRGKLFRGFEHIISGALHDLLFGLHEENHYSNRIRLLVDGYDLVKISDGLHGEQYGPDGWIEKFSKYKNHE